MSLRVCVTISHLTTAKPNMLGYLTKASSSRVARVGTSFFRYDPFHSTASLIRLLESDGREALV
eukprot:2191991-Prymnesium_polylepis.1